MRAQLLASIATSMVGIALGGCYPSFLTSRPAAKIIVTDEAGAPLEGATVTLSTQERHGLGGPVTQQDFVSDRAGKVEFGSRHDWEVQIMLPDGDVGFSWSLCISRPGFEAVPVLQPEFRHPIEISMYPSAVDSRCEWNRMDTWPRVKEREARWIEVAGGIPAGPGTARSLDDRIRPAMEASARAQGIALRSWSEYRFQYQVGGDPGGHERYILIRALCRGPANAELTQGFYAQADPGACYFDTKYRSQVWADQPPSGFGPLKSVAHAP